jgi:hypothetical protein
VEHEKDIFLIAAKQPQRGWQSRARALCAFIEGMHSGNAIVPFAIVL